MKIPQKQPETDKEKIDAWRQNIPDLFNGSYRWQYDKAIAGKSMRAAVNSKCLDCMNWQQAEVKNCDIVTCPLHSYRPYKADSAQQRGRRVAGKKLNSVIGSTTEGVEVKQ